MKFIPINKLKRGMKLARPVYNKAGVLLFDVNSKLNRQNVNSIKNFELLGIYILEPTEPDVNMSEEDKEFERLLAMSVYELKDILHDIISGNGGKSIEKLSDKLITRYGRITHKVNFLRNLRSPEDYAYKHSISVAILCTLMSASLNMSYMEQMNIVSAALLHEIGHVMIPESILKKGADITQEDTYTIQKCEIDGNELIQSDYDIPSLTRIIIAQNMKEMAAKNPPDVKLLEGTKILRVADIFDSMTSMGMTGEPYSDITAIRYLINNKDKFDEKSVGALLKSINILNPGVCVELTNKERALVIQENEENILRPVVLGFETNKIYDLNVKDMYTRVRIYDVLKTMDKRVELDVNSIKEYEKKLTEENI